MPKASLTQSKMLIDGDCFRMESPEANYEGVFTIDVDAEPPRIDIEFVEGPEAGNWSYGLFELDGDALTFCLGLVGSSRPSAFATSPGSGHALERLKRATAKRPANVKGGKRSSASAPIRAATPEPAVDVSAFESAMTPLMKRLQGEWAAVEMVTDGSKMREDWLSFGFRKTEGNETKVVFGGQTMLHAKMRLDEAAKPIAVDYLNLAGASKGRVSLGILKWDGDEVTPADFAIRMPLGADRAFILPLVMTDVTSLLRAAFWVPRGRTCKRAAASERPTRFAKRAIQGRVTVRSNR